MSWLRPAALYLMLTVLIAGSIWLFWGKAIEQKWKKISAELAKPETKKSKLPEQKIPLKTDLKKTPTEPGKFSPREEWQKTQSGIIALIAIEAGDNRYQLQKLSESNDNRWYALLRRKNPAMKVQPEKETAKPAERLPSKRKAK